MKIESFFDEATHTVSYLVFCKATKQAVVIDPVLDFDFKTGKATTQSADKILNFAQNLNLTITMILETHVHADHLTAAPYFKLKTGAKVAIGEHIKEVQKIFRPVFNALDIKGDGHEFDRLLKDGEVFNFGNIEVEVLHTPGHTPACISYKIQSALFVGDTLFMPDYGTARADFPGGSAQQLYASIQKLLSFPETTDIYLCHDYKAEGRDEFKWKTTVAEQKEQNIHLKNSSETQFVAMRQTRDKTLSAPLLLLPSIQVNMRAGNLPIKESNNIHYLKIPIDLKEGA